MNEPAAMYRRRRIRRPARGEQPSHWRARALILVLLGVIGALSWRTITEPHRVAQQVRREAVVETDRHLCGLAAATYAGPKRTTAAGRQSQAATRHYALTVLHCDPRRFPTR